MDIEKITQIIGDKWQLKIIYYCGQEKHGFNELQEKLQIGRGVLARKLKNLVSCNILIRDEDKSIKTKRVFYEVSPSGLEFYKKIIELINTSQ